MDEEQKRKNIEKARYSEFDCTYEQIILKLLSYQLSLLCDISETLLDMKSGKK